MAYLGLHQLLFSKQISMLSCATGWVLCSGGLQSSVSRTCMTSEIHLFPVSTTSLPFQALPHLATYFKSDKYIKWPLNGDMASFGSRLTKQP